MNFQPDWRWGTPEGSREFDRLTDGLLTLDEKLQWLEEMEDFSLALHRSSAALKEHDRHR
ncbi:MAG: hypothetical protein BWK80_61535 [Desulfobacteraceae bacterium IS3]|nr:MAG: hypothetical protein BWK80_61535 [Desulfobacteraceae bacterium IS3]